MTRDRGRVQAVHNPTTAVMTLERFNHADADTVADILGACLDIGEWVDEVSRQRPYPDLESLQVSGMQASGHITWEQVAGALARHPRIGEPKAAVAGTTIESAWSAAEQDGVRSTGGGAMAEGNRAYEERFGHLFLICASGLSGEQILTDLRDRLANDAQTEKGVVITELRKIADLRLAKAVSP